MKFSQIEFFELLPNTETYKNSYFYQGCHQDFKLPGKYNK